MPQIHYSVIQPHDKISTHTFSSCYLLKYYSTTIWQTFSNILF